MGLTGPGPDNQYPLLRTRLGGHRCCLSDRVLDSVWEWVFLAQGGLVTDCQRMLMNTEVVCWAGPICHWLQCGSDTGGCSRISWQ